MSVCPICGNSSAATVLTGSDRLYGTTAREFRVIECVGCGLLRLDPQPPPEELGKYYPSNYWFAPDSSAASRMEERYRRFVLGDHVRFAARAIRGSGAHGPLLDAGCGGGLFLGMMRERGFRVLGLDYSPDAAAIAWQRQRSPPFALRSIARPLDRRASGPSRCSMCWSISTTQAHIFPPRANCWSPRAA